MRDNTMRHYNDFYGEEDYDGGEKLELYKDDDDNIIFVIGHMDIFQPQQVIRFTKESVKEIIEDLNQLIK